MDSRTNLGYPSPHRARNPKPVETQSPLKPKARSSSNEPTSRRSLLTNVSIAAKVSRLIRSFEENSTKPFLLHYVTIDKKIIEWDFTGNVIPPPPPSPPIHLLLPLHIHDETIKPRESLTQFPSLRVLLIMWKNHSLLVGWPRPTARPLSHLSGEIFSSLHFFETCKNFIQLPIISYHQIFCVNLR